MHFFLLWVFIMRDNKICNLTVKRNNHSLSHRSGTLAHLAVTDGGGQQ